MIACQELERQSHGDRGQVRGDRGQVRGTQLLICYMSRRHFRLRLIFFVKFSPKNLVGIKIILIFAPSNIRTKFLLAFRSSRKHVYFCIVYSVMR